MELVDNNLVFLLSMPRSGSTLLSAMLHRHSRVYAPPELWFLLSLQDIPELVKQGRYYGGEEILPWVFNEFIGKRNHVAACRSYASHIYLSMLIEHGTDFVVDKSPHYYFALEFIDQLFPKAKKIWLMRNPLSVLASAKMTFSITPKSFGIATLGFFRYYSYFSTHQKLLYRLAYEDLVVNPSLELSKLCNFIGVKYEEGMEYYRDGGLDFMLYEANPLGDANIRKEDYKKPHVGSMNKWRHVLTKNEIDMTCSLLGADIFHGMGYSKELLYAEGITGRKYPGEPDYHQISSLKRQLLKEHGVELDIDYVHKDVENESINKNVQFDNYEEYQEILTTMNEEEKLRELVYIMNKRLKEQTEKIEMIKKSIPFYNLLRPLAKKYFKLNKM